MPARRGKRGDDKHRNPENRAANGTERQKPSQSDPINALYSRKIIYF